MVECEVCMEKFPIDCFEFFPCAHKLCKFCYHNIKQLKCPYCRLDLEPVSDVERDYDPDYDPDYYTIHEFPITNRNRRRNRKKNRRNAQRNSNNEFMFNDLSNANNISDTSLESNSSNVSNESNVSSRRNRNRNTTERFIISTTSTISTSLNNNHFSLLAD